MHSAMLQSVLLQLNVTGGQAASELPGDTAFPLNSYDNIDNLEKTGRHYKQESVAIYSIFINRKFTLESNVHEHT